MSHHLDSPLARKDPRLDISDVYVFKGTSGTVFVMNVNPMSGANGFHHEAMYEFKIDTSDDAVEDLAFRVTFSERARHKQQFTVRQLVGGDATSRTAEGAVVAEGSTDEVVHGRGGLRVFAGSAGEPFYIEGRVVTAVKEAIGHGQALDLGDFDPATAANLFASSNVSAIVLEVPDKLLGDNIGFWGEVALATDAGGWRQVQRAATPLMNTLFDFSEIHADYNETDPADDADKYGGFVTQKIAAVVRAMGTADDPDAYAAKRCGELFPDMLRYRVGSDAAFTVADRNGRGLTESAPEIMFELVLNKPVPMGLDAGDASGVLRDKFPYLSLPVAVAESKS